jgi:DNA-binding CsgD family transcriptional regulator
MLLIDALRGFLVRTDALSFSGYGLTAREMEIASRISAGRSNKEVGQEFSICERTVKHHLTNIFRKVGVSSRLELAVFVRENASPRASLPRRIEPGEQLDVDSNGRKRLFAVPER